MPEIVEQGRAVADTARQPHGRMADRDRFEDIRHLISSEAPVIVDGGAHAGTTIDRFLSQYHRPTIVAFEPNPHFAQLLRNKYCTRDNIRIHEQALGALRGTVTLNVLNYPASSSILQPSEINRAYHGNKMEVSRRLDVQQVRLDEILEGAPIDILKLDLQGYELEALKGAQRALPGTKVITTEVECVPLYEGQALFRDIDVFLSRSGFRLLNLYDLYTHPDGQLTAGDAVYLNTRFF